MWGRLPEMDRMIPTWSASSVKETTSSPISTVAEFAFASGILIAENLQLCFVSSQLDMMVLAVLEAKLKHYL